MTDFDKLYIDGAWVPSQGTDTLEVIDSTTEAVFATIPAGVPADIDRAVAAAKAAFTTWSEAPAPERSKLLRRVAEELEARRDEIADVITHEVGMPKGQSAAIQVGMGISAFATASELASTFEFEDTSDGLVVREPIGVVGCITPWNYPLNQIGAKVAYALAAGCTVVLKPSEVAPVNAFILAEIMDEIGFPAGVFNLVTGLGPVVGEALAAHPDVDMVSFTGSTRAGRRVAELAAPSIKRVALELGGKSPNVLLDDADFPDAVKRGVAAAYANSGQTCSALTRMLVPRTRLAEVEDLARDVAEGYTVGDPFADGTRLGPLISSVQRDRVRGYIEKGVEEGATLVTGGADAPESLETGYFVKPTVFSNVTRDMTIAL
jgi:acyl-CoA reductase-like NAD-dependent aldehyde dehydrogenase